jgi:hypothetical protein
MINDSTALAQMRVRIEEKRGCCDAFYGCGRRGFALIADHGAADCS